MTECQNIFEACKYGQRQWVKNYLKSNGDPNARDKFGERPLLLATENGHLKIIKMLIEAGADKDVTSGFGDTPLMTACSMGRKNIVEYFLSIGCQDRFHNCLGDDALDLASINKHLEIVRLLKEKFFYPVKRNGIRFHGFHIFLSLLFLAILVFGVLRGLWTCLN